MAKTERPREMPKSKDGTKRKTVRLDITQLIVDKAYGQTFSSGKRGWFGRATDPRRGNGIRLSAQFSSINLATPLGENPRY